MNISLLSIDLLEAENPILSVDEPKVAIRKQLGSGAQECEMRSKAHLIRDPKDRCAML